MEVNVDQDILPEWFKDDKEKYIDMCREAVKDWVTKRCVFDEKTELYEGIYYAFGNSKVTAFDHSMVEAYNNSTVVTCGLSTIYAYDNSTVVANDLSTIYAYGNSTITAYGAATVKAYDSSNVTACGQSTISTFDSATVTAWSNATVIIPYYSSADDVTLNDNAILVNHKERKISGKYVEE